MICAVGPLARARVSAVSLDRVKMPLLDPMTVMNVEIRLVMVLDSAMGVLPRVRAVVRIPSAPRASALARVALPMASRVRVMAPSVALGCVGLARVVLMRVQGRVTLALLERVSPLRLV